MGVIPCRVPSFAKVIGAIETTLAQQHTLLSLLASRHREGSIFVRIASCSNNVRFTILARILTLSSPNSSVEPNY